MEQLFNRFHEKWTPVGECWFWTGHRNNRGCGEMFAGPGRGYQFAHRVSYEIHRAPIPNGMFVLHTCDHSACVNPEHLSLGDQRKNMGDAARRKRMPLRDKHHACKLSDDDVREIMLCLESSSVTARRFGVAASYVRSLRNGRIKRAPL